MWPFTDAFTRGLFKCTKRHVRCHMPASPDDKTMDSIDFDAAGFYHVQLDRLDELCGLLFAQAQMEGATHVKLHYGTNKMIYTIAGVDYEMVPVPAPCSVDMVRALAKKSRMTWDKPGELSIQFADMKLSLAVKHILSAASPYLEITGFTGKPRIPCEEVS